MTLLQAECHEASEDQIFTPQLPTNLIFVNAQFKFTWAADKDDADNEEEKEQAVDGNINAVRVENAGLYIDRYALLGTKETPEMLTIFFMSLFSIPLEHVTLIMELILACGRWLAGRENPSKIICMKLKAHYHLESSTSVDAVKEAFSKFLLYREMTSIKIPDNATAITSCSICLEDMTVGTLATRMTCLHFFHHRCISAWLAKSATCPMCRHAGKRIAISIGDDLVAYLS